MLQGKSKASPCSREGMVGGFCGYITPSQGWREFSIEQMTSREGFMQMNGFKTCVFEHEIDRMMSTKYFAALSLNAIVVSSAS